MQEVLILFLTTISDLTKKDTCLFFCCLFLSLPIRLSYDYSDYRYFGCGLLWLATLVHNELNYITVKVKISMLKNGQLCSPGAADGGHPMLTEALNGVSYNNLGNSSSVSPSAFTKRQALCQFINVAYILLLTSVALDKFTTSSRDNISGSAANLFGGGVII